MTAGSIGHGVIHFSFAGHRTSTPASELVVLTVNQLKDADQYCQLANRSLKRRFPAKSSHVTNLLRRDWYQVSFAQSCYAIRDFGLPPRLTIPLGTVLKDVKVQGGSAWAVQMFNDRQVGPCYLFDQHLCHWFQWNGDGWKCIYEPPQPVGVYAGIGARDLLPMGKTAIRVLMNYKNIRNR